MNFPMPIDCLLIADDLTGACDAAVHFAHAVVLLAGPPPSDARLLAISTGSRDLLPSEIRRAWAAAAQIPADLIFKKIDSTLRGDIALEIAAALDAFHCDAAVVCPAYPKLHRIVRDGFLHVTSAPDFEPIDVAARIRTQDARIVAVDATCVTQTSPLSPPRTSRWGAAVSGPGPPVSRPPWPAFSTPPARPLCPPPDPAPALFCLGSDHPVTLAQQSALLADRPSALVDTRADILDALARGEHAVLRIPRGRIPVEIAGVPAAALVLSGGDTASLVCRAAAVQRIELCDEIVPGVPRGILRGGEFDGISVATKSGGFGDRDALVQVADFFTCPTRT